MISVHRAADRFRSEREGVTTWHSFSSGAHYDPANVAFGPVIACDEHLVAAGAGFDIHAHARVELLSWVISGALRHSDSFGRSQVIRPGDVQYQLAGGGIEHAERNASTFEQLRFVQLWLLSDAEAAAYSVAAPPTALQAGVFVVVRAAAELDAAPVHLFVASGEFAVGALRLGAGDSIRATDVPLFVDGAGELLVITFEQ